MAAKKKELCHPLGSGLSYEDRSDLSVNLGWTAEDKKWRKCLRCSKKIFTTKYYRLCTPCRNWADKLQKYTDAGSVGAGSGPRKSSLHEK